MTPKPGIPLNEPQTEAGRRLVEDEPLLVTGEHDMRTRVLAIEREARGIPLIDVELLRKALREAQTTKALTMRLGRFNEVWWERFASEVAAEYARLKGER